MSYQIGIDIGGTNSDAVLVDEHGTLLGAVKVATTQSIEEGCFSAIKKILAQQRVAPHEISAIFIGTTHTTNAILECRGLCRIGVLRLAGQRPMSPSPGFGWPKALKEAVIAGWSTVAGGYECDRSQCLAIDRKEVVASVEKLLDKKIEGIAVTGTFSPLNKDQEIEVQSIIHEVAGSHFHVTLSHQIGSIGFIERENASILNASLTKVLKTGFSALVKLLSQNGLTCPIWMTQNDGSIVQLEEALHFPIRTIAAGPTNSFIGATRLFGLQDAIVVDIGGTSTDIGVVQGGFPRRSLHAASIGGIGLNFSMPDVISLAIGGGSVIAPDAKGMLQAGPASVAKELQSRARSFGGDTLTLTDVAVSLGYLEIIPFKPIELSTEVAQNLMKKLSQTIDEKIRIMKGQKDLPVLFVGGAAALFANEAVGKYANVANAYGAALAEISATIDSVVSCKTDKSAVEKLQEEVIAKAILKGADPRHTRISAVETIPYGYSSEQLSRVIVTASGKRLISDNSLA